MIDEGNDTLSLSFVDCISCGLAAGLFLLIIFAILPRSLSGLKSGSMSAPAQTRFVYDDTAGSPLADVEIHIANAGSKPPAGSWRDASEAKLVFARGESVTYFREFPRGMLTKGSAEFGVTARSAAPRGYIYFHAGGRSERTDFDCHAQAPSGDQWILLRDFHPRTRKASGDCILEPERQSP